jgi:hypothetical protein
LGVLVEDALLSVVVTNLADSPTADAASGMAQIHSAEIVTDLWTFSIFLSKRPIKDTYGEIETPETSGLIRTETPTD